VTADTFSSYELWQYSVADNAWTQMPDAPMGSSMHAAAYRPDSHTMVAVLGTTTTELMAIGAQIFNFGMCIMRGWRALWRHAFIVW
jgi:hypothetical protein